MTAASQALYRRASRRPVRQFVSDYEVVDRPPPALARPADPAGSTTVGVERKDAAIEAHLKGRN